MKPNLLLPLLLVTSQASAANPAASLCKAAETTYFNCSVKKGSKLVSLCGKNKGGAGSYLQYRYGSPGQRPELIYPPAIRDPAMATTFFFDSSGVKNEARSEAGVWFEYDNTYYELKFNAELSATGNLITAVSEVLQWSGTPGGAPLPTVCKHSRGGENLAAAGSLIEAMSPAGRVWRMSPLDLYYQQKPATEAD